MSPTCFDGVQNGDETGIDCGGSCAPCSSESRFVFVTSTVQGANFGGLEEADATCQTLANAAGVPGTFKAWLSSTTLPALARFAATGEPYTLVDGTPIANDLADLTDGTIDNPIDLDEWGDPPPDTGHTCGDGAAVVMTGTGAAGTVYAGGTCGDWTSTTLGSTAFGSTARTDALWSIVCAGSGIGNCNHMAPFYCFAQ